MLLEKSHYLKVREHEAHLKKGELAYFPKETYRVTCVKTRDDGNFAELYLSEGKTPLVEGTIIGVNELIVSNDSKVEIRDNTGLMFRLGENS